MNIKPDILRFIKNLVLLLFILFVSDFLLGTALESLYFSLKKGPYAQMTYSIDSTKNTDVLIFGSSRAVRHYSPATITKITGLTCYNMGKDGQFIPYYVAMEEAALKKHIPKFIIVDMNIWEFTPNAEKYEKLSALLPYVKKHPEFIPYINEVSPWESLKIRSRTYPYNSTLFIALHDHLRSGSLARYANGYLPLDYTISKSEYETYRLSKPIYDIKRAGMNIQTDQKAVSYFRSFLNKTKEYKIKTFVIISPTILSEPETREKKLIKIIADEYPNVVFKDYSHDQLYNNHYLKFADVFHLNKQGSVDFSDNVANLLKDSSYFYIPDPRP